jgi:hypothetical protein
MFPSVSTWDAVFDLLQQLDYRYKPKANARIPSNIEVKGTVDLLEQLL